MIFYRDTLDFSAKEPTVLTIGKFDGLHMGHKKLLDEVARQKEKGLASSIFTFNIPPSNLVNHEQGRVLTTNEEKHHIFEEIGIDYFVECPFTDEVRMLEPEDFIRLMVEKMKVKCFVVGTDCRFAHDRKGNCEVLQQYAKQYDYEVIIVVKKQYEGRDISSTFVREEIEKGNIRKANLLLGYPYFIEETICHGNHLGHELGFPTVNMIPEKDKLLPPNGVYASRITIDGKTYQGVTNIGVKPTVSGQNVRGIETNIFDFSQDVYGKYVRLQLLDYLRPEKKFSTLEELKSQIAKDSLKAREVCNEN